MEKKIFFVLGIIFVFLGVVELFVSPDPATSSSIILGGIAIIVISWFFK